VRVRIASTTCGCSASNAPTSSTESKQPSSSRSVTISAASASLTQAEPYLDDRERRGDDDPKTAELVAKILMLARDRDIRDPTILEQLRH